MKWKQPPRIKVYEALGCIADKRIDVVGNTATIRSSGGDKSYQVTYDPNQNAIMANDNGSYWQGYLGYPAIAFLMVKKLISFNKHFADGLENIAWKEINTKFNNDYSQTETYVINKAVSKGIAATELNAHVDDVLKEISRIEINFLGKKVKPPISA